MDILIVGSDELKNEELRSDDRAAVDEFVRDVEGSLADYVREAEILLSGAPGLAAFGDDDEPPLADPEQRRRVEHLKWLLEMTQQSWWQSTKPSS